LQDPEFKSRTNSVEIIPRYYKEALILTQSYNQELNMNFCYTKIAEGID